MYTYKAPLKDIDFAVFDVLDYEQHYANLPGCEDIDRQLFKEIAREAARFSEEILAPLNPIGDREGTVRHTDGSVTTPKGFVEAYQQYLKNGWNGLNCSKDYEGMGLPNSLANVVFEFFLSANPSWAVTVTVSQGAVDTLAQHGTHHQQDVFLQNFASGTWMPAMGLTEPHCGSDLGMVKTRAVLQTDGSYSISGKKIFTSGGEHDYCENIIHFVLARIPGSPSGSKGVSLFLVPNYNLREDNTVSEERNQVSCGSVEKKMGLHGSPTCEMNFDAATGYLLGDINCGLHCMFTFMNAMRLRVSTQGLGAAEVGFQKSYQYARERLQMRSLRGPIKPTWDADPIIVHPDVRRMLLTQKAVAEGGRMLILMLAQYEDVEALSVDKKEREYAADLLSFLTPIAKAFVTELGLECASHAIQCFGGHGYVTETGIEQNYRDARVATLYEGTTGIQSLDLLSRKVLRNRGRVLRLFTDKVTNFCQVGHVSAIKEMTNKLEIAVGDWLVLTDAIAKKTDENPDEIGAAAFDYLMYSGYTILAYLWARAAKTALNKKLDNPGDNDSFYQAKYDTAKFYFERILPRTLMHKAAALSGADNLMSIDEAAF